MTTLYHTFFAKKFGQNSTFMQLFLKIFSEMANSVDPDQTAPEGAVWSGSKLFANSVDPDQTAPEWAVWSGSTLFAFVIWSETLVYDKL